MVDGDSPEWPPAGWSEKVKVTNGRKIKYYTNVETGQKFYSKKDVMQYVNTKDTRLVITQATNKRNENCFGNNASQTVEGTNKSHDWLPHGWKIELKTRMTGSQAGTDYKVYIDPATGNKFYSKPEVERYLKTAKQNNSAEEENKHGFEEKSASKQKAPQDYKEIGDRSHISKRQKSSTDKTTTKTHGIEGEESAEQKDSKETGELSRVTRSQKSGMNRPSPKTVRPHRIVGEESSEQKDSKETGEMSRITRSQKSGMNRHSPETVHPHRIVGQESPEQKDSKESGKMSRVTRSQKSGMNRPSPETVLPHDIERESSEKKDSKETGELSRVTRRQKYGMNRPSPETVRPHGIEGEESPEQKDSKEIREMSRVTRSQKSHGIKGEESSEQKDSKETGELSRISKRQKSGTDKPFAKTVHPHGAGEECYSNQKPSQNSKVIDDPSLLCEMQKSGTSRPSAKTISSMAVDSNSVDGLPPGWIKEIKVRKYARGIKKDPFYTDPVHGYVFHSKKDVLRYLQTGDTSTCAIKPRKRDLDSTMKDNSPTTHDASSKKLECSVTQRELFASKESKGEKCSVPFILPLPESSVSDPNIIITSIVADINENHSCDYLNEDAEVRLDMVPETRDSTGDNKAVTAKSVNGTRLSDVSTPQSRLLVEHQLPQHEKEKRSNKKAPAQSRKSRNKKSLAPDRRVSKRLAGHNAEVVADLDLGEHVLRAVVKKSSSMGLPLNVCGEELLECTDPKLVTGNSDQVTVSSKTSSQDDPSDEIGKQPLEGQTFQEQIVAEGMTSENQDEEKIVLNDSQQADISLESRKDPLECQPVIEKQTGELVNEEQNEQERLLKLPLPAELAQVSEKQDVENIQLQNAQPPEPSPRSGKLPVENQSFREKQTKELVSEKQDDECRRLQAQPAYPFGDCWSDPCLEFAFKTLTGAIPVEDTLAFQGSAQQEFDTSYTQGDGCFELPDFNNSSFYMNDIPNGSTSLEEQFSKEQPPTNKMLVAPGNTTSIPSCSVGSQHPGMDIRTEDYEAKVKS